MSHSTIPRAGADPELETLWQQVCAGSLTPAEYHIAFVILDSAQQPDQRCANGDRRPVIAIIDDCPLCGVCATKECEGRA